MFKQQQQQPQKIIISDEPGHAGRFGHADVSTKPLACGHAAPVPATAVVTEYTRVRVPDPHAAEHVLKLENEPTQSTGVP